MFSNKPIRDTDPIDAEPIVAEAAVGGGGGLARVQQAVECPICLEPFKSPKLLDCIHSCVTAHSCVRRALAGTATQTCRCCESCVVKHARGSPPVIKCPECRRDTILKGSSAAVGAAALPTNYAINGVVEALAQEARLAAASRCQGCVLKPPADWCCADCAINLCNGCCHHHSIALPTATHQTYNIATPSIKGPPKLLAAAATNCTAAATFGLKICPDHGEPLKLFCDTHKKAICLYVNPVLIAYLSKDVGLIM